MFLPLWGRLVALQGLENEEQKLKEGLGVSSMTSAQCDPCAGILGGAGVPCSGCRVCERQGVTGLFSLPGTAEWPCFIILIDFDLTTNLTALPSLWVLLI